MIDNNKQLTDPHIKANTFNEYFANIPEKHRNEITNTNNSNFYTYLRANVITLFSIP